MNKIAFIGVGIMGRSMVRNLMKAGFELHIYARTRSKVEDVISEGATFHDTIADCVKDAEAVITIVDKSSRAVYVPNMIIWVIGFVVYRILMNVDMPVGNTLPDMVITIILCLIAGKLIPEKNQKE